MDRTWRQRNYHVATLRQRGLRLIRIVLFGAEGQDFLSVCQTLQLLRCYGVSRPDAKDNRSGATRPQKMRRPRAPDWLHPRCAVLRLQ